MNPFRRLFEAVSSHGLRATLARLTAWALDQWFDFRYGVDTCSWSELHELDISSENKASGYRYQPTRVMPLRRLFWAIRPMISPDSVLVDIGSGKGRVLMVSSEFGFREARGIEFARDLCEVARRNLSHFKPKTRTATTFSVIEMDATLYAIQPDENVFILYNPFDAPILSKVLENISRSLAACPRKILIVYYNPRWSDVFGGRDDFEPIGEYDFWGFRFMVYSNRS